MEPWPRTPRDRDLGVRFPTACIYDLWKGGRKGRLWEPFSGPLPPHPTHRFNRFKAPRRQSVQSFLEPHGKPLVTFSTHSLFSRIRVSSYRRTTNCTDLKDSSQCQSMQAPVQPCEKLSLIKSSCWALSVRLLWSTHTASLPERRIQVDYMAEQDK